MTLTKVCDRQLKVRLVGAASLINFRLNSDFLVSVIQQLKSVLSALDSRVTSLEKGGVSAPVASKPAPAKKEEDDDIDLFGSDEEDEEAGRLRICVDLLDLFSAAKGTN